MNYSLSNGRGGLVMVENRRHGRFSLVMEVSWATSRGRTTDISATGCFIDSLVQVTVGETLDFKLTPSEGEQILVRAEVVYHQPGLGFGIRFKKISDPDRLRLDAILNAEVSETRRTG